MASPLVPGTDINSTNVCAGVLELSMQLVALELAVDADTRPDNIAITFDTDAGTATIAATLPVTFTLDGSGQPVLTATDYIP